VEPQAHDIIGEAVEKLTKVRDAVSITDKEQAIVIDVVASLRTLRAMYTEHQEAATTDQPFFAIENPFKRRNI
jgi:hypothetical protein